MSQLLQLLQAQQQQNSGLQSQVNQLSMQLGSMQNSQQDSSLQATASPVLETLPEPPPPAPSSSVPLVPSNSEPEPGPEPSSPSPAMAPELSSPSPVEVPDVSSPSPAKVRELSSPSTVTKQDYAQLSSAPVPSPQPVAIPKRDDIPRAAAEKRRERQPFAERSTRLSNDQPAAMSVLNELRQSNAQLLALLQSQVREEPGAAFFVFISCPSLPGLLN